MHENPWSRLPEKPPYVLPDDESLIRDFNLRFDRDHDRFLQIDEIVPEAFVGDRHAPVVLLSNNPGFGSAVPTRGGVKNMGSDRSLGVLASAPMR